MKDILRIYSDIANIQDAMKWLSDKVDSNLEDKKRFGFILSSQEAIVNAIKHGNREDKSKSVYLTLQIESDFVSLSVEDEGEGVKEEILNREVDLLKESGRGIFIMKTYCDSVEFKGNVVELKINL